jgi:predicted amidohydrolase YtcJ
VTSMPVHGITQAPHLAGRAADVVVRNSKIHTGDPNRPQASAIAIADGHITEVGDDATVASHVGMTESHGRHVP